MLLPFLDLPGGPWEQGAGHQAEGLTQQHTMLSATLPRHFWGVLRGFGCRCLDGTGWAWERLTQECRVGLSLSGLSFLSFLPSGVPGKKCGSIILSAEELSNCRVSSGGSSP